MRKMKGEKGWALIGVLIAIAILGLVAVIFASGISTGAKAVFVSDERATAESLAKSQLESIKGGNYNPATDHDDDSLYATYSKISDDDIPPGYEIRSFKKNVEGDDVPVSEIVGVPWVISENEDPSQPAASENGLQRVILIIDHNGKDAVVTLEGYTVNLGEEE